MSARALAKLRRIMGGTPDEISASDARALLALIDGGDGPNAFGRAHLEGYREALEDLGEWPEPVGEMFGWETEANVFCVVCPECAFTMDAAHLDPGGEGYTCPLCVEPVGRAPVSEPVEQRAVNVLCEIVADTLLYTPEAPRTQIQDVLDWLDGLGYHGATDVPTWTDPHGPMVVEGLRAPDNQRCFRCGFVTADATNCPTCAARERGEDDPVFTESREGEER